jgi:hypothetical protein
VTPTLQVLSEVWEERTRLPTEESPTPGCRLYDAAAHALRTSDRHELRARLVGIAALAVAWVEELDEQHAEGA